MRRRFWIIAVLVLLAVLGTAIWWWRRPERVVDRAAAKLAAAETQAFTADLTIANSGAAEQLIGQPAAVKVRLNGAFARRESERDALTADVELVTETEGITLRVEGNTRFVGDKAYVRVTKAPATFPLLAQLKDRWIELPRGGESDSGSPAADAPLFASVERTGGKKINGQSVIAYRAKATSQAVVRLLDGIADVLGTRLTAEQIDGLRQNIAAGTTVPVQLAVSPWTHELRELSATLSAANQNEISFSLQLSDRDRAQDIAAPDGAEPLEGIIAGLQSSPAPPP